MAIIAPSEHIFPIVDVSYAPDEMTIQTIRFLGTGFCPKPGWLLTCNHVLASCVGAPCAIANAVGPPAGRRFLKVQDVQAHSYADLALAHIDKSVSTSCGPLQVDASSERVLGTAVSNYSFVEEAEPGFRVALVPRLFRGHVMRASVERQDRRLAYIELSFPALSGMSGSPVIDDDMRVIGVVYRNFRSQVLEDHVEELVSRSDGVDRVERTSKTFKVVDFAQAADLIAYKDFLAPVLAQ